jgi:MoxR-like ATPase
MSASSLSNVPGFPPATASNVVLAEVEALGAKISAVRAQIARAIYGQPEVIDQTLITLLSGGHVLLVGVPGLGKSRLVETLAGVLGLGSKRVQFTPDLMPADILGSEVLDEGADGRRHFRFVPGPVFCQLLMADEINRASPRTQSALLQAMQEQRVAVGGVEHPLPRPFHVLATQNPIEQEGTYPLPEAQLDRFLLEVQVRYPDLDAERTMLIATTGSSESRPVQALTPEELMAAQALIRRVPVGETVVEAILRLVRGGRPESTDDETVRKHVAWGPGPRAAQALMLACRARALLDGRLAPSIDDVAELAPPVLRHRMALNFSARSDGIILADVIARLVERLR